ncbi:MAG: hypothetical protein ABIL09_19595 [Gemmatimonadota bacterium]
MRVPFRALPTLLWAALCTCAWPEPGQAQLRTFSTDHFVITFVDETEGTARRVAEVAEEIFPRLAAAFNYYDDYSPIHLVVLDNTDFGNGAADDYSNTVFIWASSLDWEFRGEHEWIKNVLTHEITHVLTLDKARKHWPFRVALLSVSRFDSNPDITFDFPLYYRNTPTWWVEGIAQMGSYTFGWDTWDSHRDMLLRMAVLEHDLHTYAELGTFSNRTGGYRAEMIYNQGYALLLYVDAIYGRDKVTALQEHTGVLSFEVAIQRVLGISAGQLYDDWVRYLEQSYGRQVAELQRQVAFEGEPLAELNEGVLEYHPAWSPDGGKLAYITSQHRAFAQTRLAIHDFATGRHKVLDRYVDTRISWSPDGRQIVFLRNKEGYNDLYVYDLERDEEHRISARMRARDPNFSPDGERIAFVRNQDGNSNLALVNRDGSGLSYLTNNNDGTQIYAPRWSPDGRWILFSVFRTADRDIAMMRSDSPARPKNWGIRDRTPVPDSLKVFPDSLAYPDADTSGFRVVLGSRADERDPCWLPDGSGFVFSSDESGIFNLYLYHLDTGAVEQLTNVVGGAFTPSVSADGRVAYASYHANNYDLYQFPLTERRRPAAWEPVIARDYQSVYKAPALEKEYGIGPYRGRRLMDVIPIVQVGPTFVGNTFGLNQVSGGVQISTGEALGGEEFTAWGILGKNFRESTDLNTDFGAVYQRSLLPVDGNNRRFNPQLTAAFRRREIDFTIKSRTVTADTSGVGTIYPVPTDTADLLVPDAVQYRYEVDARKDLFKDVMQMVALGIDVPLTERSQLAIQYLRRNYDESWTLQQYRQQTRFFITQDGVDISQSLPPELMVQDTTIIDRTNALPFYEGLGFYTSNDLTLAWQYRKLQPTEDWIVNPTGRGLTFAYRYMKAAVTDSLAEQSSPDGIPRDYFAGDRKPLTVNEYVGSYVERLGLPFYNSLSLEVLGAYRNLRLKRSYDPEGGFFEGRFYWPLRYYLGGLNLLSGYPYFTASGSKLVYGRAAYSFPVFRRMNARFLNFTFAKLYAELFAETGMVGNFEKADLGDLDRGDFLSDLGGELRLEMFTSYRIPLRAFLQVARPLDRHQVQRREAGDLGVDVDGPEAPPLIDRWRYYFGLGFFPQDLTGAGQQLLKPLWQR